MVPTDNPDTTLDPVELLNNILKRAWRQMLCSYDTSAELPDIKTLFCNANLNRPEQAAQTVIVNMLLELIENVGRFSPWYRRPARAFGITSMRDPVTNSSRWILAPEAVHNWGNTLDSLTQAIKKNYGLISALILVDDLMGDESFGDPLVTAHCACVPPRSIHITQSVLIKAEIMCDACLLPFE